MNPTAARRAFVPTAFALLALTGCAGERGYPALTRLPAERIAMAVPPAPAAPAPVEPLPPETLARAQRLADMVRAAHQHFATLASHGTALSELEVARGQTSLALAQLERLYADDRIAHGEADGVAGPDAAARPAAALLARLRDEGLALLANEDAVLAGTRAG
jgi:hypothetical protein